MWRSDHLQPDNAAGLPTRKGLYDPANEHDSCGVGFVARLDGRPRHAVVRDSVRVLVNLEHRGAIGGDKGTGDGAGLLLQMPDAFMRRVAGEANFALPAAGDYAVAMVFLPTDAAVRECCVDALATRVFTPRLEAGEAAEPTAKAVPFRSAD